MDWFEAGGVDYVSGLPSKAAMRDDLKIMTAADACASKRAIKQHQVLRNYVETR